MAEIKNRPLRVFLCHAHEDKAIVRDLYRQLCAEGWLDVWLDEEKLLPGQEWDIEIEKAVEAADIVLVCLSCRSTDKEGYIQKEMRFVLNIAEEKPEGMIFVIPLKLEDCEMPRRLRAWQWVDYFPKQNRAWAYQRLLESLKLRAGKLGVSTVKPAEEGARIEAEDRARIEAEEKARKEKEAQDKKAARELKRRLVEENARLAKEARERQAAEEQAKKATEKPQPATVAEPRREPTMLVARKLPRKVDFRWWGSGGAILLMLFCGVFGINYLVKNWPFEVISVNTVTLTPSSTSTKPVVTFSPTRTPTRTRTPTATFTPALKVWTRPADGMLMVFVPEGEFTMGSDNGDSGEEPVHTVYLDAFWLDQTEVTNKMYALCVADGKCDPPKFLSSYTRSNYYGNSEYDDFPVIHVTWKDAATYCAWAGGGEYDMRLPTEAEWEKAARGTDGRTFPWGEGIGCQRANYNGNCVGDTSRVGSYESGKSPYGVLDMAGNVWEWVADWYDNNYYSTVQDGIRNPAGPSSGTHRVLRGGGWLDDNYYLRSANRDGLEPTNSYFYFGFRCSRRAASP